MDAVLQDARYAARRLLRAPGFTLVAVATLGLGIGANTAIFSVLDQVLLRPLPVRDPAALVLVHTPGPRSGFTTADKDSPTEESNPFFVELRDKGAAVAQVFAYFPMRMHVGVEGHTERVEGELVSGSYFPTLGIAPAAGRLLGPSDDVTRGGHPIAVLGHGYWARRFAADPHVVGSRITVNGTLLDVVGVAPAGYRGMELGRDVAVFVPLAMKPLMTPSWDKMDDRRAFWLTVAARLVPGVARAQAQAALDVIYRQGLPQEADLIPDLSAAGRQRFLAKRLQLLPGSVGASGFRESTQLPLTILMGMSLSVLLIACANVANLQLAQAARRGREIAVRLAVGAGRFRLVRQLLVESALLSAIGGVVGIGVGSWAAQLLIRVLPDASARSVLRSELDARVLGFSLVLCAATALLCGLAPALQSTSGSLVPGLKQSAGGLGAAGVGRLRKGLVVAQVALSLFLLVGAGLMARTLANLKSVDLGFQAEALMMFSFDPELNGYPEEKRLELLRRVKEAVEALPEVASVALDDTPLLQDSVNSSTVEVAGYEAKDGENMNPQFQAITPGLFATLGVPLVSGRDFDGRDGKDAAPVAIVNESFARYFYHSAPAALGRRFQRHRDKRPFEIVGVVRDSKGANLRTDARVVYRPILQEGDPGQTTCYVRARGASLALAESLRRTMAAVDPQLPIFELKTMPSNVEEALFPDRLLASLSSTFGALATLLAALGLYGVMSLSVGQRSRELGVRIALGANPRDIHSLVLGEVGRLWAFGLVVGVPAGLAGGFLLKRQLYGLAPYDPWTLVLMVGVLGAAALAAGYGPAARAARVDPIVTLRYE
jgi:predicted permease